MRCEFCGTPIDKDSVFCSACGKRINIKNTTRQPAQRKSYRQQKRKRNKRWVVILVCVLLLAAGITVGGITIHDHLAEHRINGVVRLVQDGYLGEYTDITVKEMLDINYSYYEKSVWDGGTTDAGRTIVQAKYFDNKSGMEPTVIQLEMLNDECFKVSAFKSPMDTISESTDLFAILNNAYLVAYAERTRFSADSDFAQLGMIARLEQISGSAVAYGASAQYSGSRADICALDGRESLRVSTAMLLDHYGIIDMAAYYGPADDTQPTEPEESQPEVITEPVPEETVPLQTTTSPTEEYNPFMVTVKWPSGGVNVRSGPGTNYGKVGRLNAGQETLILEVQYNGSTQWGNVGSGWICMDYVDIGTHQTSPSTNTGTSVSMTVSVDITAGELKIRSGPDISYSEVGRLLGGEIVAVTEVQQTGSTQWGRIAQGWICMDYVNTIYGTQNEQNNAQRFVGNWQDQNSKRCCLTIEPGEYGIFVIDISWGNSAFSTSMWRAVGEYDATADCIRYHDCDHWESISDGNGNFGNDYYYTGGQGMFYFSGGNLLWQDYNENVGYTCSFVK